MRLPVFALIAFAVALLLTDGCIYRQLKGIGKRWLMVAHVVVSVIVYAILIAVVCFAKSTLGGSAFDCMMWGLFALISVSAAKLIYMASWGISLLPRLWQKKCWKRCRLVGAIVGILVFFTMWWGAIITPRHLDVVDVELQFDRLPRDFDGYRVLQVSDLHVGTYGQSTGIVENIVEQINAQHADLVVFTGDIVNRETDEILPFVSILKQIKAKDGVISILGNHDYGDYYKWTSESAKKANMDKLVRIQRDSLGWNLLRNEHFFLKHGSDSIAVIGVENWGEPPFPTYGDLGKAYPDVNDGTFKLLLSHNPKHWDEVVSKTSNIDLTLSGHTHAMQMMLSLGSVKLSPSVFRYKHWQGLTEDDGKKLYVNIGTGEVGIPMRIGATPELTVFTLKRK